MIFIYSIVEKQLTQKSINATLKSNSVPQDIFLTVSQKYISWLGPWFPASPKMTKAFNQQGEEIRRKEWIDLVKSEARSLKETVPFQWGFFRNTIILLVVFGVLAIIRPGMNKRAAEAIAKQNEQLQYAVENLSGGDIAVVSFYNDVQGKSMNGIGLMKINHVEGDTIFINRSKTVIDNMKPTEAANIDRSEGAFETIIEKIKRPVLISSVKDRVLITYPTDVETSGYTVGSILSVESN
ncbi:hypothetical protein [Olivibacter domesticus]|uniref:Uncharacterized protein n=1 Tax=Olivibacter domesticus TaxID=407022 RepID=A0A1H7TMB1_OLID1|nr:hypothetical protein [Olivibacter domesticus]SEL85629.1 hypothetical protein SAMN05661044_03585 [Olivibacter domesticus]